MLGSSSSAATKVTVIPKILVIIAVLYVVFAEFVEVGPLVLACIGLAIFVGACATARATQYGKQDKAWAFAAAGVALCELAPIVEHLVFR